MEKRKKFHNQYSMIWNRASLERDALFIFKRFRDGLHFFEFPAFAVRAVVKDHRNHQMLVGIENQLRRPAHGAAAVLKDSFSALGFADEPSHSIVGFFACFGLLLREKQRQ